MAETPEMTETIRSTLEDFGVVKPPRLPKLDALVHEVRKRGGSVKLEWTDTGATAHVGLSGNGFDAYADTPAVAVAQAFSQALLAEPAQTSFFGGDGTLSDEAKERLRRLREQRQGEGAGDDPDGSEPGNGG